MGRPWFLVGIGLLTTSCAPIQPPETPEFTGNYPVEYSQLGACIFDRIDRDLGGLRMVDIRATHTIRISQESEGIRTLEMTVIGAADRTSAVNIREFPGLLTGAGFATRRTIAPAVEACAQVLAASSPPASAAPPRHRAAR